jgi:hypothetical protein
MDIPYDYTIYCKDCSELVRFPKEKHKKFKEFLNKPVVAKGREDWTWAKLFKWTISGTLKGDEDELYQKRLTGFSRWEEEVHTDIVRFFDPDKTEWDEEYDCWKIKDDYEFTNEAFKWIDLLVDYIFGA